MHLDVLRHGETSDNAAHRISGRTDAQLTAAGRSQARRAGEALGDHYDVAFCSPLTRSRDTLTFALGARGLVVPRLEDARLAERRMGCLEGRRVRPLPAYDRGDLDWAPEGGEPYRAVLARVLSFLADLHDAARAADRPLRVVVSTHAGPMRVLIGCVEGATDARRVLTAKFANGVVHRTVMSTLSWPSFVTPAN